MTDIPYPRELSFTPTARLLHWVTAVLVLIMVPIGIVMANIEGGPAKDFLYHIHRSIGILLLPIVLVRLFYRITHPAPPLPDDIPVLQRWAAYANHWTFYVLLIVQPLIGWIATSAYRAPILFFWLFEVPPIWPENRAFSEQAFAVHRWIGVLIAILVVGHIGAALYHHFIRKDRVLMRMVGGA
jgi:cytochrome b561